MAKAPAREEISMWKQSQKTVPDKLSAAELENLRLLRKRMSPPGLSREAVEKGVSESEAASSVTNPLPPHDSTEKPSVP